jgi:hypothetical protein
MGDNPYNVIGVYKNETTTPTVYSVDIHWGAMEFTYTEAGTNEWNPRTHSYTLNSDATWTADRNTVRVVNHSNADVDVTFSVVIDSAYSTVTAQLDKTSAKLAAGVEGKYDQAAEVTATLTLGGILPEGTDGRIGTVTVNLK